MTTETRNGRAFLKRLALLGAMAFVLLFTSVTAPPAGHAAFPGENGKIAFHSNRDGNFEIYAMNPDGSGQTNLTNNPGGDFRPAWSPDGSKIAFQSSRDGGNPEIYVMNADGTGQTRLTNDPAAVDGVPVWSPDEAKIAFASNRDGNFEIYVMDADGSGQTRLTNNGAFDAFPAWSPDGSKIAFASERDGNREIYVTNADGSGQTNLTNNSAFDDIPAWSPDGSQIAFQSSRDGNGEIYAMNADGSGQTNLTNNSSTDFIPAWSPDGSKIAFNSLRDGNEEIYVMNADGSGQTNLTNNGATDEEPDWQPLPRLEATIDIKPGSDPNSVNPKSRGTIPVAILSGPDFDAPSEVDKASLTFGRTGDEESLAFCTKSAEDVNGDGLLDQVCHFSTQDTGFQCGDTEGILRGQTVDGVPIEGSDSVRIVPCR